MFKSKLQKFDRSRSTSGAESFSLSASGRFSLSESKVEHSPDSLPWAGSRSGAMLNNWSESWHWLRASSGKRSWEDNKIYYSEYVADIITLLELSKDKDKMIRIKVANNPNVNKEILDALAKDKDDEVRQAARLAKIKCLL